MLNREAFIGQLKDPRLWDVLVVGGGATGLGIAVDAASRGYSTIVFEQSDFARGTSSRSTKLVHGGVRYLAQGRIRLVYEALHERGLLLKNAGHLVRKQSFIIPCYSLWEELKYLSGLKMYDWLAGRLSFGNSSFLNSRKLSKRLPHLRGNPKGGVEYFDGQFDDARLAITLAQTAADKGAVVLNYFKVTALKKNSGKIAGAIVTDLENGDGYAINARSVINATGVFVDDIRMMDEPEDQPLVQPSQGIHLVLNKKFLDSTSALLIPKTSDARVLFAVPWHDHVLLGTTDTPLKNHSLEPRALEQEIDFILQTVQHYFSPAPRREDVLSVFAGLRPLAMPKKASSRTREISRDHKLVVSPSGLITITGGKWTTYRKMAEDTVDAAIRIAGLSYARCITKELKLHGSTGSSEENHLSLYGTDASDIEELIQKDFQLGKQLVAGFPQMEAEAVWAVRKEMARKIEDVLARRMRILFLDARAAMEAAPRVAEIIQLELQRSNEWKENELREFNQLASGYLTAKGNPYS
ncbi:MAG: FAD-dependent oxidoreductase [Flavisolibacter sp.]